MKKIGFNLLLGLLIGCQASESARLASDQATVTIPPGGTQKHLYSGYHAESESFTNLTCIVPDYVLSSDQKVKPEYLLPHIYASIPGNDLFNLYEKDTSSSVSVRSYENSNQEGSIEFAKSLSSAELLDKIAGGVNINMNLAGGTKLSGGAEVALQSGSNGRSTSLTYIVKLKKSSVQVEPLNSTNRWALTPYGAIVKAKVDELESDEEKAAYLAKNCGTHYVSAIDFGATFVANLKVTSLLKSDHDYIAGRLNMNLAQISGGGEVKFDSSQVSSKSSVKLTLFQQGGDVIDFAKILADDPDVELTKGTSSDLLTCDEKKFEKCLKVFAKILRYASGTVSLKDAVDKGKVEGSAQSMLNRGFADQLGSRNSAGFVVMGYESRAYTEEQWLGSGMLPDRTGSLRPSASPATPVSPVAANPRSAEASVSPSNEGSHSSVDPQVVSSSSPSSSNPPVATGSNPTVTAPTVLSPDTITKLAYLKNYFRDYINLYTYVQDTHALVAGMRDRLKVSEINRDLLLSIATLQRSFLVCRDNPEQCNESIDTVMTNVQKAPKLQEYLTLIENILHDQASTNGFRGYCETTAVKRLRDNPGETIGWRSSMDLLARRSGAPRTITVEGTARPIMEYQFEVREDKSSLESLKEEAGLASSVKQYCKEFDEKVKYLTSLNFVEDGGANSLLIVEPLTFLADLNTLTIKQAQGSGDIYESLGALLNLSKLTIRSADLPSPYMLASMSSLKTLTLYDYGVAIGRGGDVFTNGLEQFLRSPIAKQIEFRFDDPHESPVIELGAITRAFRAGRFAGARGLTKVYIEPWLREDSNPILVGVNDFFGIEERSDGSCYAAADVHDLPWFKTQTSLTFNLAHADNIEFDHCCKLLLDRCRELRDGRKPGIYCGEGVDEGSGIDFGTIQCRHRGR